MIKSSSGKGGGGGEEDARKSIGDSVVQVRRTSEFVTKVFVIIL